MGRKTIIPIGRHKELMDVVESFFSHGAIESTGKEIFDYVRERYDGELFHNNVMARVITLIKEKKVSRRWVRSGHPVYSAYKEVKISRPELGPMLKSQVR